MPLNRASRLLHTVPYLKPRQVGWRLYYRAHFLRSIEQRNSASIPVEEILEVARVIPNYSDQLRQQ